MTDYKIEDLGNGKKRISFEVDMNSTGNISSTGKSHIIASSNGFKPVGEANGKKVTLMFNVIRKI